MRHTLGSAALHDVHPCAADDVPAVLLNDKAPPHGFCRPCGGVAGSAHLKNEVMKNTAFPDNIKSKKNWKMLGDIMEDTLGDIK